METTVALEIVISSSHYYSICLLKMLCIALIFPVLLILFLRFEKRCFYYQCWCVNLLLNDCGYSVAPSKQRKLLKTKILINAESNSFLCAGGHN